MHIFISHSTEDDAFVKALRENLEERGLTVWVDSRSLRGGDSLKPGIKKAIEEAGAFVVVISSHTFSSSWVLDETRYALTVKEKQKDLCREKQKEGYRIVPILLDGTPPDALRYFFNKEPLAVKASSGPGGIAQTMPELLAALGHRAPNDPAPPEDVEDRPVEELTLELTDPFVKTQGKVTRAAATARLVYRPAGGAPAMESLRFTFVSPVGPIENEELRWYLEEYFRWPIGVFQKRAEGIEQRLPEWGHDLYKAAAEDEAMVQSWKNVDVKNDLRFTVFVDPAPFDPKLSKKKAGRLKEDADEASALLLGLPWELLHDGKGYLFKGARPVYVRRRLPNRNKLDVVVTDPPVRILLVSPRPEDDKAGYIDHRVSAITLVEAMESLGDMVDLTILSPPAFSAMNQELKRARDKGKPYHVVHFDGHGVFDKIKGLGALCFEDPKDSGKLEGRAAESVDAEKLAETIRDHRIPLFFLEACQSAKADKDPTASVATRLLDQGVASVIAMSHSVLVETARRFVDAFYKALVTGSTVGQAVVRARVSLKDDTHRGVVFGAGPLKIEDWFVPVLFQEEEDVRLFKRIPSTRITEINREALRLRMGEMPEPPAHSFVGRSRLLLAIERLLDREAYAALHGQGGEGKTTLAVECARWLVRSNRFDRAVFVSVETFNELPMVLDSIGRQLVPGYSAGAFSGEELLTKGFQPIERALEDFRTIMVIDNMETILPSQAPDYDPSLLENLQPLFKKLLKSARTRLLFTSREPLPAPFDQNRLFILQLTREEAIELVQHVMSREGLKPCEEDPEERPEIEALVEAVNCHAQSLALVGPALSRYGVGRTTTSLRELMKEMHNRFPESREQSLFASVELSLRRLPPKTRETIRALALCHGGVHLIVLGRMLQIKPEEARVLGAELSKTGLGDLKEYGHLRLHPALAPYLDEGLTPEERTAYQGLWAEGMWELTGFLCEQQSQDTRVQAVLTIMELPNLMALLYYLQDRGNAEETLRFAGMLEDLLQYLGRPRILAKVSAVRETEARKIGQWSHAAFDAARRHIERLLERGAFQEAYREADDLLKKSLEAGEGAYQGADYDIAGAHFFLGRVFKEGGASQQALGPIEEARKRFQALADRGNKRAAIMVSASLTEKGGCLRYLGRLDEAAAAYEEGIKIDEALGDTRGAAVGRGNLGTVRMHQGRFQEALEAYEAALKAFEALQEPGSVATAHHQIGIVYEKAGDFDRAEAAYKNALRIFVQQKNDAGQASSLGQLGNLYDRMGGLEEAVVFYSQAADKRVTLKDVAHEGFTRNNLAATLIKLKRYGQARQEIRRAIECIEPYGHAAQPWKAWAIFQSLEEAEGNTGASASAREKAIELFLSYRRDGGENHSPAGQLFTWFRQALGKESHAAIRTMLGQFAGERALSPSAQALLRALQAILEGSRDPALAEAPEFNYELAAEIRLLLEGID